MISLYCLVEGDYLRGATENPAGATVHGGFWVIGEDDNTAGMAVVTAVVDELAARAFVDHGTSAQVFSDGYDAYRKLLIEDKGGE
jgi:hypothetical protein